MQLLVDYDTVVLVDDSATMGGDDWHTVNRVDFALSALLTNSVSFQGVRGLGYVHQSHWGTRYRWYRRLLREQ